MATDVKPEIKRVVILTHGEAAVAAEALRQSLAFLAGRDVEVLVPPPERDKHGDILAAAGSVAVVNDTQDLKGVGLCLVLGGDGTMLRGFHLTRGLRIPVAGVNLGRVGFLTTIRSDEVTLGLTRLLAGEFTEHPLLGLEAKLGTAVYAAANDVVVNKGDSPHTCSLALTINDVTLFEVLCDGVVVGTPAGSSAYSLAAGGPLLGIAVQAYVISLVAPHAVGVRPVVAAPEDVLQIINTSDNGCCAMDVDGQRVNVLAPGAVLRIRASQTMTSLALLKGDSLYHHFRDRLL